MIKIYPFEYIHKSFDQCTQEQRQEVFEVTKRMLAQQFSPLINLIKQMGRTLIVHCINEGGKEMILEQKLQITLEQTSYPVPSC